MTALASGPYALGPSPVLSVRFGLELSLRSVDLGRQGPFSRPWLESLGPILPHTETGRFMADDVRRHRRPPHVWRLYGSKYPSTHTALTAQFFKDPEKNRRESYSVRLDGRIVCSVRSNPHLRCRIPDWAAPPSRPTVASGDLRDAAGSGVRLSPLPSTTWVMGARGDCVCCLPTCAFCFSFSNNSTLAQLKIFVKRYLAVCENIFIFLLI